MSELMTVFSLNYTRIKDIDGRHIHNNTILFPSVFTEQ